MLHVGQSYLQSVLAVRFLQDLLSSTNDAYRQASLILSTSVSLAPNLEEVDPPSTTMESTLSDHSSSGEEGTTGAEEDVANAVRVLLRSIGEDPEREGLRNTPRRFAKAFAYFTKGYNEKPEDIVAGALFNENHQGMVVVKDIPVYSLCEHHLVPFFGKAHIGYIPDKHVVGLSKLARLVNVFSQRLQVQERLTNQIATSVHDLLQAKGVGVIIECTHMCMEMRGVKISGARTVTRSMLGLFNEEEVVRRDFEASVGYSTCRALEGSTSTASSSSCCVSDHKANLAVARIVSPSATKPQVETPIVPALAKTTSGSCVQHTHARDFKLYLRCATQEYSRMVHVIKEAITAFGKSQNTGLSMLDIGAGNGHLLRALCAEGVRPSTYTAFEPDAELCSELQTTLRELDFNSNNTMVFQDVFGKTTQLPHAGGVADIVLMSHSLYGIKDKYSLVANALRFVAPEGVLLIFHHWTARGTISEISSSLFDDGLLHYTASYNVALDLTAGLTEDDLVRVSAYTKQDLLAGWKANTMSASRTLGYIAVEPHACRLGSDQEISLNIEAARTSVSYAARSKVPAAVIQPATVVGIQSCVLAALKKYRCSGKLSVVGGGHSSNCFADVALVVDMVRWNSVSVDGSTHTVVVGGGATIGSITEAAEKYGLVVPLGDRPGVGMGLVLQGGINHLMRSRGLATDNILRVLYVSPKGELCVAETDEDLWPFRGAGSNFGIVLEISLRAYAVSAVTVANSEYYVGECTDNSEVLASYGRIADTLPSSVALDGFLFWGSLERMHFATSLFDSSGSDSIETVARVNVGIESMVGVALKRTSPTVLAPSQLFDREIYMSSSFDAKNVLEPTTEHPKKLRSIKRCLFFGKMTQGLSSAISEAVRQAPTKWCYVHILHGGGRVAEFPATFAAFGCRDWSFAAVLTGRYDESTDEHSTRRWLQCTTRTLLPMSKGVYGADLGPAESELSKRAFGVNSLRLAHLKRMHDPSNIFGCACPLTGSSDAGVSSDPRVCSRGVVVIFCGRRFAGKDWLAAAAVATMRSLLMSAEGRGLSISLVRISDETKHAFANETWGVTAENLINDRFTKEEWRDRLTEYYEKQKELNPGYGRACFVDLVNRSQADILFLTGMRDGIDYARALAGRAVVLVHVIAPGECKMSRGWQGPDAIDQSPSECSAETVDPSVWDLVYSNDAFSNPESASTWTRTILSPAILKGCVRSLPDCPSNGVVYKDITGGLLLQPFGLSLCIALIMEKLRESDTVNKVDAVLAPEAMAFLFAGPIASSLQKPVVLARKSHRLPGDVDSASYAGSNITNLMNKDTSCSEHDSFHIAAGSIVPGQKVLIVDDCLASGATLDCLVQLVHAQGGDAKSLACVMELPDMGGGAVARNLGIVVLSLFQFDGS